MRREVATAILDSWASYHMAARGNHRAFQRVVLVICWRDCSSRICVFFLSRTKSSYLWFLGLFIGQLCVLTIDFLWE
jgi:hypothetical protein